MRNNKAKEILELWKYQEFFSQQPLNKIKEPSKISGSMKKYTSVGTTTRH